MYLSLNQHAEALGIHFIPVLEQLGEVITTQVIPIVEELKRAMESWRNAHWPQGPEGLEQLDHPHGVTHTATSMYVLAHNYYDYSRAREDLMASVPGEYLSWYCIGQGFPTFILLYVPVALVSGAILDEEGIPTIYRTKGEPIPTVTGYVESSFTTYISLPHVLDQPGPHGMSLRYMSVMTANQVLKCTQALCYLREWVRNNEMESMGLSRVVALDDDVTPHDSVGLNGL